MIEADKKHWFDRLFTIYLERLMRKHFSHFYVVDEFPKIPDGVSVTFTPNHFSWWDGFFIQKVQREYLPEKHFHIMMLSEQLKVYKFFKWMGAYGIDQSDTKSLIKAVKYTRELLASPENLTVIYPQGEIRPYDKKPHALKEGITRFVGGLGTGSVVIPAAFRVQFEEEKLPAIYCSFGEAMAAVEVEKDFQRFEIRFIENIEKLDRMAHDGQFKRDIFK